MSSRSDAINKNNVSSRLYQTCCSAANAALWSTTKAHNSNAQPRIQRRLQYYGYSDDENKPRWVGSESVRVNARDVWSFSSGSERKETAPANGRLYSRKAIMAWQTFSAAYQVRKCVKEYAECRCSYRTRRRYTRTDLFENRLYDVIGRQVKDDVLVALRPPRVDLT